MNLDAIDAEFLADCLGRTPERDEVQEVRGILSMWSTLEQYKVAMPPLSKTKVRARKMARYARNLREAIDEFDLSLPSLPDLRVPLWQIESTCRLIDRDGTGRHAGKGPNWPLGFAVETLMNFFDDHVPKKVNDTAARDDFVYEMLMRSGVKVVKGVTDPKDALTRNYFRKTHRNESTGRWEWNPRGLRSS